jgi:hypothetical protein
MCGKSPREASAAPLEANDAKSPAAHGDLGIRSVTVTDHQGPVADQRRA